MSHGLMHLHVGKALPLAGLSMSHDMLCCAVLPEEEQIPAPPAYVTTCSKRVQRILIQGTAFTCGIVRARQGVVFRISHRYLNAQKRVAQVANGTRSLRSLCCQGRTPWYGRVIC